MRYVMMILAGLTLTALTACGDLTGPDVPGREWINVGGTYDGALARPVISRLARCGTDLDAMYVQRGEMVLANDHRDPSSAERVILRLTHATRDDRCPLTAVHSGTYRATTDSVFFTWHQGHPLADGAWQGDLSGLEAALLVEDEDSLRSVLWVRVR